MSPAAGQVLYAVSEAYVYANKTAPVADLSDLSDRTVACLL